MHILSQDYAVVRLRNYQYLKEKILASEPLRSGIKRKDSDTD